MMLSLITNLVLDSSNYSFELCELWYTMWRLERVRENWDCYINVLWKNILRRDITWIDFRGKVTIGDGKLLHRKVYNIDMLIIKNILRILHL